MFEGFVTKGICNFMNLMHITMGGPWIFSESANTGDTELVLCLFVSSKDPAVIPNGPFIP